MTTPLCSVCGRDHSRVNDWHSECAVADCPHRRRSWSDGTGIPPVTREPEPRDPLEPHFDRVEV